MRLFTAVVPPAAQLEELADAVARLREAAPGADALRWTRPAGWHYTLAFLGEVDEGLVPELTERFRRGARRSTPYRIAISGGGHFGQGILWAGAAGEGTDLAAMRRLAERVDAGARRAGVVMEESRHYTPHLTLARTRRGIPPAASLAAYAAELDGFTGTPWRVAEFSLIRSHPPSRGEDSWYETLATWPLGR
ncbi:RNA 2',3'-cyclic phosphodiesterase [Streptomyces qinzhouensis]|uniref:RNA 2',3'-cyclic phosphodiesterase n=1 Tax=Streptomyces qinzhouensis TaxID=2599401 RepID=A0A5B8JC00_9ACTN|nr:RNA 2',3'-cyclic phosphodiesterase [Streptomyces qinzhouensis]QDY77421.1 RNA 2',3'-cyclic phosphodiesterase [Streptomyces qinzhouensis]